MAILNIEPASRAGMRFLISLYGLSETGKTFSALRLAAGMEPNPAKRMLLDTEGGQRGRAYVDHIPGGYLYASLSAPFMPERYIEALSDIEAAGVNVLVIDSISHAWFAEGGILDIVDASTVRNDMAKWKEPKRRLTKMTGRILHSDMHIILCSRAKQPLREEPDPNRPGKTRMVPGEVQPVQEKSLRYDMTVMAQMLGDGRFDIRAPAGKCPGPLRDVFAAGEVMTEDMGARLISWLGGADVRSPEQRALEVRATAEAENGADAFRQFWTGLNPAERAMLKPKMDNYASIAKAADAERARQREDVADQRTEAGSVNSGALQMAPADWTATLSDLKAGAAACPDMPAWIQFKKVNADTLKAMPDDVFADWNDFAEAQSASLKEVAA